MARKKDYEIEMQCRFGNLGIGTRGATISVTVDRTAIDVLQLEPVVVGGRLDVRLRYDCNGQKDAPAQQKFVNTANELRGIADCPSLIIKPGKLGFRLSFAIGNVDIEQLTAAVQMVGEIGITRIGNSGDHDDDE